MLPSSLPFHTVYCFSYFLHYAFALFGTKMSAPPLAARRSCRELYQYVGMLSTAHQKVAEFSVTVRVSTIHEFQFQVRVKSFPAHNNAWATGTRPCLGLRTDRYLLIHAKQCLQATVTNYSSRYFCCHCRPMFCLRNNYIASHMCTVFVRYEQFKNITWSLL